MLARPHSTIQHMLRCPSPPTSLNSLMPKTSCRVLTSAENLKNIEDKQKKKDEEARLKEERWKIREQKKKENQKKRAAKCSTPKCVPRKCNCMFSVISLPYCPKQASMGACSSSTKTRGVGGCMEKLLEWFNYPHASALPVNYHGLPKQPTSLLYLCFIFS